jgi:hypothetical protein
MADCGIAVRFWWWIRAGQPIVGRDLVECCTGHRKRIVMIKGFKRLEVAPNRALKGILFDTNWRLQHRSTCFVASTKLAARFLKMLFRVPETELPYRNAVREIVSWQGMH